jgi:allantoinase
MVLVDLQSRSQLQANDLFYRHQHSPYIGRMLRGRIVRTLVRGNTIFLEGKVVSGPIGQFLKPSLP